MAQIWTKEECIQQAMLRLLEQPHLLTLTAEQIQDESDMPFNKDIIEIAKTSYNNTSSNTTNLNQVKIATAMECVEQIKLRLGYQLPEDFDSQKCTVQKKFNLPFRKGIIKTALFDLYSKSQAK
jgi:hypothetical protein